MFEFYRYVWLSTKRRQVPLILLAMLAAVLAMVPLELQRHIINTLAGRERPDALLVLCAGYLAAAWSISGLRYLLNTRSAGLGESAILILRRDVHRVGRSMLGGTRESKGGADRAGTLIAMIASEAEAVGKLIGECISTPLVQAGTLLSVLGYMLWTETELGVVVLLVAIPQVLITPLIQRRINALVKVRVGRLRDASDIVAEEMRPPAADRTPQILQAFEEIYGVRLRVFRLKFAMKLALNGLQSVSVFILLLVGGLMVLRGQTEIGIVVAFISGLDRIVEPLRELIAFLRATAVAKVQYDMIQGTLGHGLQAAAGVGSS
jgi:ABC-type multidrug transport system fused ATPase/permease subunit